MSLFYRMMTSSKTTLAFLIYGLLVQCNVCSPLNHPNIRYGNCSSASARRWSRWSCGFRGVKLDGEWDFFLRLLDKKNRLEFYWQVSYFQHILFCWLYTLENKGSLLTLFHHEEPLTSMESFQYTKVTLLSKKADY